MTANTIRVKWIGPSQSHHELGELVQGETYQVPEELGKAWVKQGVADPQSAEAHKLTRGTREKE